MMLHSKLLLSSLAVCCLGCDLLFCNEPVSLEHVPFSGYFSPSIKQKHPDDYQEADYVIHNFCAVKTKEDEEKLMEMVDSVVVEYIKDVPRDKYKYVMFMFFEDWVQDDFDEIHMYDHPIDQSHPEAYIMMAVVRFRDRDNENRLTYKIVNGEDGQLEHIYTDKSTEKVCYRELPVGLFAK